MSETISSPFMYARAAERMSSWQSEIVAEVAAVVASDGIVVVGMAQNPHVRRARRALEAAGHPFTYKEYGSYLSQWRPRLALKMWAGWPTYPMVFVKGGLLGGASDLAAAIEDGSLGELLA